MKDTIHTIRRSAKYFFSGTLLSRMTGMLRDISMAYVFGTQPAIAAFMVAFRFAHLLRRLFGEGALQSAFIPEFEALRHQNEERAFTFFRQLSLVLSIFLILLIVISCTILSGFVWLGHLTPDSRQIIYLTLLMFPSLLFICLYGLNASLLQCEKSYFIPSTAPVSFNLIWILCVLSLQNLPAESAMPWLSLGVILACFCQWIFTVPPLWKYFKQIHLSWPSFNSLSPDLRRLIKPLFLGILGVSASQINNALDSLFARFADVQGPAFLWYSIRIQQLPLALFGIAIAGAILPPLSRALKAQRWEEYDHFLRDALERTWFFMFPLTGALFLLGDLAIIFLYGHGDFGSEAIVQTTYCLWAYGIGLIPAALVLVLAPASYAQSNYSLPAFASFATLLINLFLNSLFIFVFDWGSISVAFSTSVSAWMNFAFLGWKIPRSKINLSWNFFQKCLPITLTSLLALLGTYLIRMHVFHTLFFSPSLISSPLFFQFKVILSLSLIYGGLSYLFYWPFNVYNSYTTSKFGI